MLKKWQLCGLVLISCVSSFASAESLELQSCFTIPEVHALRTTELQTLVTADQEDRQDFDYQDLEKMQQVRMRDLERRARVGEIFAEGCLTTPADFAAASLIYQHGEVPLHYFQAFLWANAAYNLGDKEQSQLVAMTIDRYLVVTGKKQLFGTQYYASVQNPCYCLEPTEASFPEPVREKYIHRTLAESLAVLEEINQQQPACPQAFCEHDLQASPKGTVPGFW